MDGILSMPRGACRSYIVSVIAVMAMLAVHVVFASPALAASTLRGEVRVNESSGALAPNVRVRADGANPTATDGDGQFLLTFPALQPGDSVKLEIVRDGWAVVNDIELDRQLPSARSEKKAIVVISKSTDRQRWALTYYRLRANEAVEFFYRRRIEELQRTQKWNEQERIRLLDERNTALLQSEELAKRFAAAQSSIQDIDIRRAQALYLGGKVEEALALLPDTKIKQQVTDAAAAYRLRGHILATSFHFSDALSAYANAAELVPDDWETQFQYGNFLASTKDFEGAITPYRRAYVILDKKISNGNYTLLHNYLLVNDGLAHALQSAAHGKEADDIYANTARAIKRIQDDDRLKEIHLDYLQFRISELTRWRFNINIALYFDQSYGGDAFDEANRQIIDALSEYEKKSETDDAMRIEVASMHAAYGKYLARLHSPASADREFSKAISILKEYGSNYPASLNDELPKSLDLYCSFLIDQNRLDDASYICQQALTIRRSQDSAFPARFKAELSRSIENYAVLLVKQKNYSNGFSVYSDAIEILKSTSAFDFAEGSSRLCNIYIETDRHEKAVEECARADSVYKKWAVSCQSKDHAIDCVVFRFDNLLLSAKALMKTGRLDDSSDTLMEATRILHVWENGIVQHSNSIDIFLQLKSASLHLSIADLMVAKHEYSAAAKTYSDQISVLRKISQDPNNYKAQLSLADALDSTGMLYSLQGSPAIAKPFFEEMLSIRRSLFDRDPNYYGQDLVLALFRVAHFMAKSGYSEDSCKLINEGVSEYGRLPNVIQSDILATGNSLGGACGGTRIH